MDSVDVQNTGRVHKFDVCCPTTHDSWPMTYFVWFYEKTQPSFNGVCVNVHLEDTKWKIMSQVNYGILLIKL